MKLSPWELPKALAAGLQPLYAILGEEPLTALEAAEAVRRAARLGGYEERVPLVVEPGFDWNSLAVTGASGSLFGTKRLIDLKIPNGKTDAGGSRVLTEYIRQPAPDTLLLVTAAGAERRTANTGWAKAAAQAGVLVECRPLLPSQLPRWIAARLRSRRVAVPPEAPALIAEYAQGNLLAAAQAIERLVLLAPGGRPNLATVREAVVDEARFGLFDLVDAALVGNAADGVRMLARLGETGTEPPLVLWALARELRTLASWAWAAERGGERPGVWQSRRSLVSRAARRRHASGWQALLLRATEVDLIIKGRARGDAWTELERLLVAIAGHESMEPV